jgi:lipoprotein signal peptidase
VIARSPSSRSLRYAFLAGISSLVLACDVSTKRWAEGALRHGSIEVVKEHVELALARNPGGAWSTFVSSPDSIRRPLFSIVSLLAIVLIVSMAIRARRSQRALLWGLALVLGGALGNVLDRVRSGAVTDFILVHAAMGGRNYEWPVFNVADVAISLGVGLILLDSFVSKREARLEAP